MIAPPHSKPISGLFSFILSFLLVRPLHVDVIIVNEDLSRILFFNWPPEAVNSFHFLFHAIDGLGGAIVETLKDRMSLVVAAMAKG